ncbi:hypothetical protein GQ457_14G025170 [Hibiscus cannabinus]
MLNLSAYTDGGGRFEKFKSEFFLIENYRGEHVWILCSNDMVREDKNYEEASFAFYMSYYGLKFEVEKCGVKVFYVDAESYTIIDAMRCDTSNQNVDSEDDGDIERSDQAESVVVLLLGSVLPNVTVNIRNSYAVPHTESAEQVS